MNKNIMKLCGFEKELAKIEAGCCPNCGSVIKTSDFRDELSLKEFKISGLCNDCQDDIFGIKEY